MVFISSRFKIIAILPELLITLNTTHLKSPLGEYNRGKEKKTSVGRIMAELTDGIKNLYIAWVGFLFFTTLLIAFFPGAWWISFPITIAGLVDTYIKTISVQKTSIMLPGH